MNFYSKTSTRLQLMHRLLLMRIDFSNPLHLPGAFIQSILKCIQVWPQNLKRHRRIYITWRVRWSNVCNSTKQPAFKINTAAAQTLTAPVNDVCEFFLWSHWHSNHPVHFPLQTDHFLHEINRHYDCEWVNIKAPTRWPLLFVLYFNSRTNGQCHISSGRYKHVCRR